MNPRFSVRVFAFVLSALIPLMSAGLAPYEAAAAEFSTAPGAQAPRLAVPAQSAPSIPVLPQMAPSLASPSLPTALPMGISEPAPAAASAAAAPLLPAAFPVSAQIRVQAAAVSGALSAHGALSAGSADSASSAGRQIDEIVTGRLSAEASGDVFAAVSGDMGVSFAKPAGAGIRDAAEAYHQEAAPAPRPPAPPQTPEDGGNRGKGPAPKGAPLLSKIVSALVGLAPGALLGWPLLVENAPIVGAVVILASLGLATSPFMSLRTPKLARSLPGIVLAAGGVLLAGFGVALGLAPSLVLPGALAAAGGWGLVRFGRNDSKWKYMDASEAVLTYIGALAAVTSLGLGFSLLAGPLATAGIVVSSVASMALLTQLPGWIGSAVERAFAGISLSVEEAYRVSTSVRRDTNIYKRLTALSEAYVRKSVWNLTWLGLFVWLPLVLVEAASTAVGAAFGLLHGLIRAPIMAAWGAAHALWPNSRLTQTLGYMGRWLFGYNKAATFNDAEKLLIPAADSPNPFKSAAAALGIRGMQLAWLTIGTLGLAAIAAFEWGDAVIASRKPHEARLDDPAALTLPADPLPLEVPGVQIPAATGNPMLARALAAAIGLAPLVLLAMPVMKGGGIFGAMIAGASLLVAVMPLIPAKHGGAASLAGGLLAVTGLLSAAAAARFFLIGLPVGAIVGMGLAAFFGGIGLRHLVSKLRKQESAAYDTDSPLYALGFVGALAVSAGLDAALLGKGGLLADSLFAVGGLGGLTLSFFLPRYLWRGLGETLRGAGYSIGSVYKALSFWHDGTDFGRNLSRYLNGIVRRWWVAGGWVAVPYLVMGAAWLAQAAISLVVGLAAAVYQAPARYIWGAAYHANPNSRFTRFMAGFGKTLSTGTEGKGATFGRNLSRFFGQALGETAPSGRPTVKAFLTLVPAALVSSLFLIGVAISLTPLWLLAAWLGWGPALVGMKFLTLYAAIMGGSQLAAAISNGIRNARGPKAAKPSYDDQDNPDFTWNNREAK